jgi:2-aminoadipate transaminase
VEQLKVLYKRRRDVMLEALSDHFGDDARWTTPQGGLFIWATLDERIDTTDLLALARESEGVAFVPGRAAYMDGRSGSSSMRLNFAGVPDADIREGMRRIGKVVREQVSLFGTLSRSSTPPSEGDQGTRLAGSGSGTARADRPSPPREETGESGGLADVVELPRREREGPARRRRDR